MRAQNRYQMQHALPGEPRAGKVVRAAFLASSAESVPGTQSAELSEFRTWRSSWRTGGFEADAGTRGCTWPAVCGTLNKMAGCAARPPAYYAARISTFLAVGVDEVLGALAAVHTFDLEASQRLAWQEEIEILTAALARLPGRLYLEFDVPRLASRIDAVLVSGRWS